MFENHSNDTNTSKRPHIHPGMFSCTGDLICVVSRSFSNTSSSYHHFFLPRPIICVLSWCRGGVSSHIHTTVGQEIFADLIFSWISRILTNRENIMSANTILMINLPRKHIKWSTFRSPSAKISCPRNGNFGNSRKYHVRKKFLSYSTLISSYPGNEKRCHLT